MNAVRALVTVKADRPALNPEHAINNKSRRPGAVADSQYRGDISCDETEESVRVRRQLIQDSGKAGVNGGLIDLGRDIAVRLDCCRFG